MSKKPIKFNDRTVKTKESKESSSPILLEPSNPFLSPTFYESIPKESSEIQDWPEPDVSETTLLADTQYYSSTDKEPRYIPLNLTSAEQSDLIYFDEEEEELDLLPYDITHIDITDPNNIKINKKQIEVTSVKKDGVTPGLNINHKPGKGMLKFGKYISKKSLKGIKQMMAPDHEAVLEELLATNIAKILGLPASNVEMVLVETSQEQIDQFVETKEFKGKPQDSKTIFVPALLSVFENNTVELAKIAAGNNEKFNQAHTKPNCEGNFSNKLVGKDYTLLSLLAYLSNDTDIIGSQVQNKLLQPSGKIFSIDTQISGNRTTGNITIRRDGRLNSTLFESRKAVNFYGNFRHFNFRNCSMINDHSFPEMFHAVKDLFTSGKDRLIMNEFKRARRAYFGKNFPQKEGFLQRINTLEKTVQDRLNNLRKTFEPYWNLYQLCTGQNIFDKNHVPSPGGVEAFEKLGSSLVALEELLSPSRMYSSEGVPLRAPHIPYRKHFFWHERNDLLSCVVFDTIKKTITINLKNTAPEHIARLKQLNFKITSDTLTCSFAHFTKMVTGDRVRLLTHPETLPLKAAFENKMTINYLQDFRVFEIKDQKENDLLKFHYTQFQSEPDLFNKFKLLSIMYEMINNKIPSDVFESKDVAHDRGWGIMVESRAKIIKEQQKIMAELVKEDKTLNVILKGATIYDLFAKADLLDISYSLNQLLETYCTKKVSEKDFQEIIDTILSFKTPVWDIFEAAELANSIRANIRTLLNLPKKQVSGKNLDASDSEIGLPSTNKSANNDLQISVSALTQGRMSILTNLPAPPNSTTKLVITP